MMMRLLSMNEPSDGKDVHHHHIINMHNNHNYTNIHILNRKGTVSQRAMQPITTPY